MLALVFGLLLASPALDGARAQLRQGKLEQVLFALQPGDAVPPEEAAQASALLVDAARLAHARKDKPLALQLAQMGLRRDPHSGAALKLLGEWSLQASEFNLAITYGHQWVRAEPGSEEAARFLARAEELERNWKPIEIQRGHRRRDRSQPAPAAAVDARPQHTGALRQAAVPSGRVVLYGTTWCGVCTLARGWLTEKGIAFENKDIEADREAARELQEKERKARMRHRGVPVIEVNGKLLRAGFSPAEIQRELRRSRG